jgi:phosphate butyryltransferase
MISSLQQLESLSRHQPDSEKFRVVVAGAEDKDLISILDEAISLGMIKATLVGSTERLATLASQAKVDLSRFEIIDAQSPEDSVAKSVKAVKTGLGDILMKGCIKTGTLIQRVLDKTDGLRTARILSHVAVTSVPNKSGLLLVTDAGINIAPDLARKKDIVMNAVQVAHALGIDCPKVAILSYIESADKHASPSITDAVMLTEMSRNGMFPGCIVEGPYALDNAVSPASAATKGVADRKVAGNADIVVTHDIHMGNAIYKAIQVWVGAPLASVVIGCAAPIIVPSRADTHASKLLSISLAIQLMKQRQP